jgi:hypothetical protein
MSFRTLYRRLRQVAIWRRSKLIGCGDTARAGVAIARRLGLLPTGTVV